MKTRTKVLSLVLAAVLLMTATVFATMAYLTDDDAVVNTFTVGNVQIKLDEAPVNNEGVADQNAVRVKENDYHLLPGHSYDKDPTVTVLHNSENCYVKMTVTVSKIAELDAIFAPGGADLRTIFTGYKAEDWIYKTESRNTADNTITYEFWYKAEVPASTDDTVLPDLFTGITVPGEISGEQLATIEGMTITVNAYAIQADGFEDAAAAWAAYPDE